MASMMLMAASQKRALSPVVQALDIIRARVKAMSIISTLRQRFATNAYDMRDGKADTERTARGQALGYQRLIYV
jgi:hypothetical protein